MGQLAEGLLGLSGWTALAFLFVLPALEAPAFLGLVLPGEVALILGGVLAAQAFTQQARTLAAARGINCVALDYDALRGIEPNTPTLF